MQSTRLIIIYGNQLIIDSTKEVNLIIVSYFPPSRYNFYLRYTHKMYLLLFKTAQSFYFTLQAVSALCEMFSQSSVSSTLRGYFPELFSCLLLVLGTYIGAQPPSHTPSKSPSSVLFIPNRHVMKLVPSLESVKTLRALLLATGYAETLRTHLL